MKGTTLAALMTFLGFTLVTPAEMKLCDRSSPSPNSSVQFVDKHSLVPKVTGCIWVFLSMRCCMAGYSQVRWFQQLKNGTWTDFLLRDTMGDNRRYGDDDNQTAIFRIPGKLLDDGNYKCVGYGPKNAIEHQLKVTLRNCPDLQKSAPVPFLPEKEESSHRHEPSGNVTLTCGAIFGTECDGSEDSGAADDPCRFRWESRTGKHSEPIPEGNSTSSLRVYYSVSGSASSINDLTSTLFLLNITGLDYATYVCFMSNKYGETKRMINLVNKRRIPENLLLQDLVVGVAVAVLIILLLFGSAYRNKWNILIKWNEIKHKFTSHHGEPWYDVLLLHTSSVTIDNGFARYCQWKLEQSHFKVIVEDNITPGTDTISEWMNKADDSKWVVVILSPAFLTDEEQTCRLPLRNIIRTKANILFVLFQVQYEDKSWNCCPARSRPVFIIDGVQKDLTLTEDLRAAARAKTKVRWPVNIKTSDDGAGRQVAWGEQEVLNTDQVTTFWNILVSHLQPRPSQKRQESCQEKTEGNCNQHTPLLW